MRDSVATGESYTADPALLSGGALYEVRDVPGLRQDLGPAAHAHYP